MPGGGSAQRDYVRHPGAVGGGRARRPTDRVVLIRQYRHAGRRHLWELPAGLIDVAGRAAGAGRGPGAGRGGRPDRRPVRPAARRATPRPGTRTSCCRVYLARDLSPVPAERAPRRAGDEEAELVTALGALDEAVAMVFRGEITQRGAC